MLWFILHIYYSFICIYIYIYIQLYIYLCMYIIYIHLHLYDFICIFPINYIVTSYLSLFISIIYICTVFMQYSHGKLYYIQFNITYIFIYVWLSMYYVYIYIFLLHMHISLYFITHPQWSFEGLDIIDMLKKHHHSELPPRNSPQVWLCPVGDGGAMGLRRGENVWNLILLRHKQHWIPSNFSVFLVHWNSITWFQGEMCLRNADRVIRCTKWSKAKGERTVPLNRSVDR